MLAKQVVIEFRLHLDGNAKEFLGILVIQAPLNGTTSLAVALAPLIIAGLLSKPSTR